MNHFSFILIGLFLLGSQSLVGQNKIYHLSTESEDYNTRYFYYNSIESVLRDNEILYLDTELPSSFVVETGALKDGADLTLWYNETKALRITKKRWKYKIGHKNTKVRFKNEKKVSLYFVNDKLIVYVDDTQIYKKTFILDKEHQVGFNWSKHEVDNNKFIYCYEPVPFVTSDYGKELERDSIPNKSTLRIVTENVGKEYSITPNTKITCNSTYSTRFEYQFHNSKEEDRTTTQRARSEIAGVYATSPMNKWIMEFDIYIPSETKDDDENFEIITQIHEGSTKPTTPPFYLAMSGGFLKCCLRGDSKPIEEWNDKKYPMFRNSAKLKYLSKGKWHHIKAYIKEAYREDMLPLTKIWVDGELVLETSVPNCYHYEPRIKDQYGYYKFGIYKPGWMTQSKCDPGLSKRVYYFDNIVVKN